MFIVTEPVTRETLPIDVRRFLDARDLLRDTWSGEDADFPAVLAAFEKLHPGHRDVMRAAAWRRLLDTLDAAKVQR